MKATTTDDVLAVLADGERISYSTLLARLKTAGIERCGVRLALSDSRLVQRWRTGEVYSEMHVYDEKQRGPLYVERRRR